MTTAMTDYLSIDVRQALQVVPRSTGSDGQLDWSDWFPRPRLRPSILDREMHAKVAEAVERAAFETGVARHRSEEIEET